MSKLTFQNIFDAITDDTGEAADLQFRADMMLMLRNYFEAKKWPQAEIAERLEISQPRVSELVNGKIQLVSSDKLICYLRKVGFTMRPHFEPATKGRAPSVRCDVRIREAVA